MTMARERGWDDWLFYPTSTQVVDDDCEVVTVQLPHWGVVFGNKLNQTLVLKNEESSVGGHF
jgi:hypothetical protein